ncbi:MAG: alpha/beta hydrolase [Burkholderiaceae bacterium]
MTLPVVLLHFFGSSHREWETVTALFVVDRPVLAFDLPGFGDAADCGAADVDAMTDYVDTRIVEAGWSDCVVVGHSMSGKIAAVLAARQPAYLRGLVLVTASPPSPEPMTEYARRKLMAFDHSRDAAADYIDGITEKLLPDPLREVAISDAMRASPEAWQAWVSQGSREDRSADVGRLALPTLVVVGRSDPSLGEDVQRRQVMPHFIDARVVVMRGGHALPLENPADLHREIDAFITALESHFE